MKKSILFIISSKNPSGILIKNITNLNKFFDDEYEKKICIVDSSSTNFDQYNDISNKYPSIDINFIENKNWEYGAYKYAYNKYPNYDIYCCLQDTSTVIENIDLSKITDNTAFTFHHNSGFYSDPSLKNKLSGELLKNVNLEYSGIIDISFTLATHNLFIVTNYTIKDIFETLINPPQNKRGSKCYERLFGLYFIIKNYETINISKKIHKINGKRK